MAARIPDDVRAAIADDVRAGLKSRNQIARDHNVSPQTVTNVATEIGVADPFSREHTKKATAARRDDQVGQRAGVAADLLSLGQKAMLKLAGQLDDLNPRELTAVMGVAFDKHVAMTKVAEADDADRAATSARHAQQLTAALRLAVARMGLTADQEAMLGPALRDAVTALTGEAV